MTAVSTHDPTVTPVVVVGGGIMGAGIAFVAAVAGHPVTLVETFAAALASTHERLAGYEAKARERSVSLEQFSPVRVVGDLEGVVPTAGIVIEAVPEDLAIKCAVFEKLGALVSDSAVLASNTSGLSIQVLGEASGRPGQVVGLHFFNPVPAMKLVEVVRSPQTSDETVSQALAFCAAIGKETVEVRDLPGFITTRLGCLLLCEAVRAFEQGVASAEGIDTAMRLGYNHPMGPLALADRVGLDTLLAILDDLREAWGEGFRAPPLLRQMVAAGKLGVKSGEGFYKHGAGSSL